MIRIDPAVLYKQDVSGNIRLWTVEARGRCIVIKYGQLGGAMQVKEEGVPAGKAGRTVEQQIQSQINSRIKLQLDKGYTFNLEEARTTKPTNTLGFELPMLAQRYDKVKLPESFFVQVKSDGNRCLVTKRNGVVTAYTRAGKVNPNLDHILEAAQHIPEGFTLDGELYCHGVPLQTLRSWIARKQANTLRLSYVVYDHVSPAGYAQRLSELRKLRLAHPIRLLPTDLLTAPSDPKGTLSLLLRESLSQGYEGLILRHPEAPYETGKRSKYLIKLKPGHIGEIPMEEEEYTVVDVIPSKDGWAILVCMLPNGNTFKVSAPGSMDEKYRIMINRELYLGKLVTVQFANYTQYDTPFHPVAIAFRERGE